MSERKMYNFPFVEDGQTYWRSRSCAVVGFVFCFDKDGYVNVLANQRGVGAPSENGKWNVPCGYLDFNEDGVHGVAREVFEETGVKIKPEDFIFDSVSFSENNEQNVNLRYWVKLNGVIDDYQLSNAANEENETSDIRWIRIADVPNYEWAFGHQCLIPEMCGKHVEYYMNSANEQCSPFYLVNLNILIDGKTISTETLTVCQTREKCKEYTDKHIKTMIAANAKEGVNVDGSYSVTSIDAIVKWCKDGNTWHYWYNFIPVEKYE